MKHCRLLALSASSNEGAPSRTFVGSSVAKARLPLMLLLWAVLVGAGFVTVERYASAPGDAGTPLANWIGDSTLPLDAQRPTLILFAHPRCPCTRATVEELDGLLAKCNGGLRVHVVFYTDAALGEGWERTDLWRRAASIPGVEVHADPRGALALRFGAKTSGECMVYGTDGNRLFAGGITAARGHAGDNEGASAIVSIVRGSTHVETTPVFGCSLQAACAPTPAPIARATMEVSRD